MHEPFFDEHTLWSMVGQLTSLSLHVMLQLAWLAVALTVIRRANKPAATLMAIAGAAQLVLTCLSPAVTYTLGPLASRGEGGFDAYLRVMAMWTVAGSVLGVGLSGVMLAGVVRLARGRSRDVRDPDLSA